MKNSINLLNPSTGMKSDSNPEKTGKPLAVVCLLLVIIVLGTYGILRFIQGQALDKTAAVRRDINTLVKSEKANQVQGNVISEWNQMSNQIDKLKSERPKLSKYLDELKAVTPPAVVLTNVLISEQPFSATITGVAASPDKLAQFARNLQESIFFKNCMVAGSRKRPRDNMYDFTVTVSPAEKGGGKQ